VVHSADVQDREGAKRVLWQLGRGRRFPRLRHLWADGAYAGDFVLWSEAIPGWRVEVVRKPEKQRGFQVLPKRWIVERTFAWLFCDRRLSRDYETCPRSSEAWIRLSMIGRMLRRLAH